MIPLTKLLTMDNAVDRKKSLSKIIDTTRKNSDFGHYPYQSQNLRLHSSTLTLKKKFSGMKNQKTLPSNLRKS